MDSELIHTSLVLAADRAGDPAPLVYARLFGANPDMLALFAHDRSDAVKGEMLARAFDTILDLVGDRSYGHHLIRAEMATHDAYGVPPLVFATFFQTIAATIAEILGPDWTPATAAAWAALLGEIDACTAKTQ